MVCILPTTDELNAALARANAAYRARYPRARTLPEDFEGWCRVWLASSEEAGPCIDARVIGIPDARLLADGFDVAMLNLKHPARAVRVGF